MDASFWHDRWESNRIGFHGSTPNPALVKHFVRLNLKEGSRVFVPLCGKTLDIAWLLSQGHQVVAAELSQLAIEQLFDELGVTPKIEELGALKQYSAPELVVFVGDIFDLDSDLLGQVDAVYDRAALVALPADMRKRYTAHLATITNNAPQLLLCFDYDQSAMAGPPFSVVKDEVMQHYGNIYQLTLLECEEMAGGLKGVVAAEEMVWLIINPG